MGIMVYSLLWVMQDFVHQPYGKSNTRATPASSKPVRVSGKRFPWESPRGHSSATSVCRTKEGFKLYERFYVGSVPVIWVFRGYP